VRLLPAAWQCQDREKRARMPACIVRSTHDLVVGREARNINERWPSDLRDLDSVLPKTGNPALAS